MKIDRVMIADDNEDVAAMLQLILEISGYDVRVAHEGREALSLALTWRPDCAVLDVAMPGMTGIEIGKIIRKKNIPMRLIAITGWGQPAIQKRVLSAGFDIFLVKPVDIDTIKLAIERGITSGKRSIKPRGGTDSGPQEE